MNKKINEKMNKNKTRKGGIGTTNPRKSCADNKKDWDTVWKHKPGYEFYNPVMLYPGRWNFSGVPTENGLRGIAKDYDSKGDNSNNIRYCDEPSNKSCFDNKRDWNLFWANKPGHELYDPYTLYEGNPYNEPKKNGLTDAKGKPTSCYEDMDFMKYVNSDKYKKEKEEEVRNATSAPKPYSLDKTLKHLQHMKEDTKHLTREKQKQYLYDLHDATITNRTENFLQPSPLYTTKEKKIVLNKSDEESMPSLHEYTDNENAPFVLPREHVGVVPKTTYKTRIPILESPEEEQEELLQLEEERQLQEKKRLEREARIQTGIQEVHQEELNQQQKKELEESESMMQEEVSMIVSHNTRIQCLLDAVQQNESNNKIRFMNCAILKMTITPKSLYLSMVYEGNLSEKEKRKISAERPYYVKNVPTIRPPGYILYPNFTYRLDTHIFTQYLKLPPFNKKYTFFIVRHGQAMHNDKGNVMAGKLHIIPDTSLTSDGIEQAKIAGQELYNYLTEQKQKVPTHFFVSDLRRTHETLFGIVKSAREQSLSENFLPFTQKPVVLPCASELPIKGVKGNCDQATGDSGLHKKLAAENYSSCKVNSDGSLDAKCNPEVNWNIMYLPFYGGKVRGQEDTIVGRTKQLLYPLDKTTCRNTSMIAMAIYYLTEPQFKEKQYTDIMLDNTLASEIEQLPYEEQMKWSLANRGGRTRRLKLKRNKNK